MVVLTLVLPLNTYANTNVDTTSTQQTQASAVTDGNKQSIIFNSAPNTGQQYSGQYTVKSAPQINAPGLSSAMLDTCMGSSSGGVTIIGAGVTGGTTWKDEECVRRLNARELANTLGDKDAAKELLCGNPEINAVYIALGRPCKLSPSTSTSVVGGALINYRKPIDATKDKTLTPQEKAEIAREIMRDNHGF